MKQITICGTKVSVGDWLYLDGFCDEITQIRDININKEKNGFILLLRQPNDKRDYTLLTTENSWCWHKKGIVGKTKEEVEGKRMVEAL